MARASGGANNMRSLSGGGGGRSTNGKDPSPISLVRRKPIEPNEAEQNAIKRDSKPNILSALIRYFGIIFCEKNTSKISKRRSSRGRGRGWGGGGVATESRLEHKPTAHHR